MNNNNNNNSNTPNKFKVDDGMLKVLDNVMHCVLDDIDDLLEPTTLPPIPSEKSENVMMETLSPNGSMTDISKQMGDLQLQQFGLLNEQSKQLRSLSTLAVNIHNRSYNNNNCNNHYANGYITPNTSYESLASLGTIHSSTASPAYPICDPPLSALTDFKSNDNEHMDVFNGSTTIVKPFEAENNAKLQLKDYVFISKDCTRRLGLFIVNENWGHQYGLLYKYLDYIFRCQAFKGEMIEVNDNGKQSLVFHSGLQRRSDNQLLYVLLVPNKKYVAQKWRVSFGNIKNSFMSKDELLAKFSEPFVVRDYLPNRTKFASSISELLYDETYTIEVNWEERLTTNKDRLGKVLGNLAFFGSNTKFLKLGELIDAFDDALKQTQRIAELNPRLAVAQGFVDTKHCKYRMELLLPIVIEFPKYSRCFYTFALAIGKSTETNAKKYVVKSVLTMDMAYANARLVGYVDSSWLYPGNYNNGKMNINDFFLQNNMYKSSSFNNKK